MGSRLVLMGSRLVLMGSRLVLMGHRLVTSVTKVGRHPAKLRRLPILGYNPGQSSVGFPCG